MPFLHKHQKNDEVFIVVSGRGQFLVDGECIDVQEGSVVRISPPAARAWRNNSDAPLYFLCVQYHADSVIQGGTLDGVRAEESSHGPTENGGEDASWDLPRLFSWRTHQAQDLRSRAVFWAFRIDREHCGRHSVGSALPPNGMAVPFGLASFGSCGRRQRPSVLARLVTSTQALSVRSRRSQSRSHSDRNQTGPVRSRIARFRAVAASGPRT